MSNHMGWVLYTVGVLALLGILWWIILEGERATPAEAPSAQRVPVESENEGSTT